VGTSRIVSIEYSEFRTTCFTPGNSVLRDLTATEGGRCEQNRCEWRVGTAGIQSYF